MSQIFETVQVVNPVESDNFDITGVVLEDGETEVIVALSGSVPTGPRIVCFATSYNGLGATFWTDQDTEVTYRFLAPNALIFSRVGTIGEILINGSVVTFY